MPKGPGSISILAPRGASCLSGGTSWSRVALRMLGTSGSLRRLSRVEALAGAQLIFLAKIKFKSGGTRAKGSSWAQMCPGGSEGQAVISLESTRPRFCLTPSFLLV